MKIKFFYQTADVVTMVALAALLICLIIVVAQKKGQEGKYDRKIKAAAAYMAVFFVILAGAAMIMSSAGYSALKNRVKEACPGAHSFHSIEIRQIFTGWDKDSRTDNEKEAFAEVTLLQQTYPSIKVKRVISYCHLEKLMRVTHNPQSLPLL